MKVKIQHKVGQPVRVVRVHKPRKGSALLGEFKDQARAERYIAAKSHELA